MFAEAALGAIGALRFGGGIVAKALGEGAVSVRGMRLVIRVACKTENVFKDNNCVGRWTLRMRGLIREDQSFDKREHKQ